MENDRRSFFNDLYAVPDPWRVNGGIAEKTRLHILNGKFSRQFSIGLDIGCGEGHVLSSMKFLKSKHGVDISEVALGRAAAQYPDCEFFQADIINAALGDSKYDFISCFETLYYLDNFLVPGVLEKISQSGTKNCVFVFSVVTIGCNEHRKYFTLEEFSLLLEANFKIKSIHPVSLLAKPQNLFSKLWNLANRLIGKELTVKQYLRMLDRADKKDIYQQMFICEKKF